MHFIFEGPFVQVDELMETFRRCTLPESKYILFIEVCCEHVARYFSFVLCPIEAVEAAVELITGRLPDAQGEGNGSMENHAINKSLKRPNADSDEEDDKGAIAPPIHDIYRARQQKRIR